MNTTDSSALIRSTPAHRDAARRRVTTCTFVAGIGTIAAAGALTAALVPAATTTAHSTSSGSTASSTTGAAVATTAQAPTATGQQPVAASGGS